MLQTVGAMALTCRLAFRLLEAPNYRSVKRPLTDPNQPKTDQPQSAKPGQNNSKFPDQQSIAKLAILPAKNAPFGPLNRRITSPENERLKASHGGCKITCLKLHIINKINQPTTWVLLSCPQRKKRLRFLCRHSMISILRPTSFSRKASKACK